jgi:hypothetical protein
VECLKAGQPVEVVTAKGSRFGIYENHGPVSFALRTVSKDGTAREDFNYVDVQDVRRVRLQDRSANGAARTGARTIFLGPFIAVGALVQAIERANDK